MTIKFFRTILALATAGALGAAVAAPANDNFDDAQSIVGITGEVTGSNVDATFEEFESLLDIEYGRGSVWYEWVAPADGKYIFKTAGSTRSDGLALDTVLTLCQYDYWCEELYRVDAKDDNAGDNSERLCVDAVEGEIYYFSVSSYGTAGNVKLSWAQLPVYNVGGPNASDSYGDGSESCPFASIQTAVDKLYDIGGGTVCVKAGTYGPVTIAGGGCYDIIAEDGPENTIIDGDNDDCCFYVESGDYAMYSEDVKLIGFTLANGFSEDGGGAHGGCLYRCILKDNVAAFRGGGCYCSVLDNCLVVGNLADGSMTTDHGGTCAGGGAFASFLYNCTVVDNAALSSGDGMAFGGGTYSFSRIEDSEDYRKRSFEEFQYFEMIEEFEDFEIPESETSIALGGVYNSIVYRNVADGGKDDCFWSMNENGGSEYEAFGSLIGVDPKFCNGYHLDEGSPAIDAGEDGEIFHDQDLDGNSRHLGKSVDAGCYESAGTRFYVSGLSPWYSAAAQTAWAWTSSYESEPSWELLSWPSWMDPEAMSGDWLDDMKFKIEANATGSVRTGQVVVSCDGEQFEVPVNQAVAATAGNTVYGLFVGVEEYEDDYASYCAGCETDAKRMYNAFTTLGNCTEETAEMLCTEEARKSAVRSKLADLAGKAVSGDVVIYTHSSHGGAEREPNGTPTTHTTILCYDEEYEDAELADDLDKFKAGVRVIVILDTCHSAGMFDRRGVGAQQKESVPRVSASAFAARVQSLLKARRTARKAGRRDEYAGGAQVGFLAAANYCRYSLGSWDGGAFTSALLEGWESGDADFEGDADGQTNFHELFCYAALRATGNFEFRNHFDESDPQCFNEAVLLSTLAAGDGSGPEPLLTVVKPVLSSSDTTFTDSLTVSCSCDTAGAIIRYTTDGSPVTDSSQCWNGDLQLTETTTIRVKAFKDGMEASEEAVQTYTKEAPKVAVSKFTMDGYQAVVCGVIGATADSFKSTDGFGNTRCLVDSRIVDAEKTSGWNNDTYWCTALSQMDMLVWLGWAQDAGYTDVDDMADYFRSHPEFLCTKPPLDKKEDGPQYGEESYGDVFNWFGEQYEDSELSLEEDDFSRDVLSLALDHGNGLIQIGLVCDCSSKHWADLPAEEITHVVVCCGYVYDGSLPSDDPNSLKGIFIIDPDNDQETNGGARTAPNSISYRPVIWDPECEVYAVAGVWDGRDGYIESSMILYAKPGYTPIGVDVSQSGPLPPLPVEKVQAPVLNPSADTTFELSQRVTCTCPTAGATIRFTTNDTAVAESSPVWVNLTLTTTTVVRVKAFKANMQASDEVKCVYTLNGSPLPKVETPVLDPPSNVTFATSLPVKCTCPTEGATIRFATNETDVITETFPVWADLTLTTTTVIRVKAFKANMQASEEVKCVYTFDPEVPAPDNGLWTAPVVAVGKNDRTEATAATTYTGWLHDSKGNLTASFTMKVGKANKNGIAKVTMTVTDLVTGIKSKYTGNYNVEEGEIEGGQLDGLALGEDGVVGKIGKETLTGGRMVNKTEAAAVDVVYKNHIFAFAFQNTAGKNVKGAATFTVKFSGKGKAKISGTLMDGTKVSTSAQLIVGDKGCALPISFSKKGKANFGIVLWFNEKKADYKNWSGLTECTLGDGVTDVKVEFVGCDEVDGSMAKAKALEVDGKKVADIAVNGTKWVATAAKGFETAKPKVTYAAKKGTITGSYKATVTGAAKPVSAKITGVWIGKTGVGAAVMKVNKGVRAFPVLIK